MPCVIQVADESSTVFDGQLEQMYNSNAASLMPCLVGQTPTPALAECDAETKPAKSETKGRAKPKAAPTASNRSSGSAAPDIVQQMMQLPQAASRPSPQPPTLSIPPESDAGVRGHCNCILLNTCSVGSINRARAHHQTTRLLAFARYICMRVNTQCVVIVCCCA